MTSGVATRVTPRATTTIRVPLTATRVRWRAGWSPPGGPTASTGTRCRDAARTARPWRTRPLVQGHRDPVLRPHHHVGSVHPSAAQLLEELRHQGPPRPASLVRTVDGDGQQLGARGPAPAPPDPCRRVSSTRRQCDGQMAQGGEGGHHAVPPQERPVEAAAHRWSRRRNPPPGRVPRVALGDHDQEGVGSRHDPPVEATEEPRARARPGSRSRSGRHGGGRRHRRHRRRPGRVGSSRRARAPGGRHPPGRGAPHRSGASRRPPWLGPIVVSPELGRQARGAAGRPSPQADQSTTSSVRVGPATRFVRHGPGSGRRGNGSVPADPAARASKPSPSTSSGRWPPNSSVRCCCSPGGKDSVVMLQLAQKAFWPGRIPFPVMHIDTGHNFPEVLEFRDRVRRATRGQPVGGLGAGVDRRRSRHRGERTGPLPQPSPDPHPAGRHHRAPVRRRVRWGPPGRGEGPGQGAGLLLPGRVRPVGPEEPAPRAVVPLQRPPPDRGAHPGVPPLGLDGARHLAVHRRRGDRPARHLLLAPSRGVPAGRDAARRRAPT